MKRLSIVAAILLTFLAPAFAADNYTATQGSGKTFGCKDVAGVCLPEWLPVDSTAALFGVVGNPFFVTVTGTMPLPTGASTAALQTTGNTALTTINTTLGTPMQATGGTVTANLGTIGAAATAANQATEIASLATIASNTGASVPAGTAIIGYTSNDVCAYQAKLTAPFSTSSAGPVSIVALSGSTKVYVCSISAITDTAIKLSFIDGTGGSCASAQHAIWGSTTAANGMSLAANGGFTTGSGNGTVGVTAAASAFCLLQSGTSLLAGNITYVQQ